MYDCHFEGLDVSKHIIGKLAVFGYLIGRKLYLEKGREGLTNFRLARGAK